MKVNDNPSLAALDSARQVLLEPYNLDESKILAAFGTVFEFVEIVG